MDNKECNACNMLTIYDDIEVCPMCLWEQDSTSGSSLDDAE